MRRKERAERGRRHCHEQHGKRTAEGNQCGRHPVRWYAHITAQNILDERARELYLELWRRQDLVRAGQFTSDAYVWQWKGGTKDGKAVEDYKNLYPIPTSDLMVNDNLKQNPGYSKE